MVCDHYYNPRERDRRHGFAHPGDLWSEEWPPMGIGYSKSPAASVKRPYDLQIMDNDVRNSARVDFQKGDYIKQLIKLMSRGTVEVKTLTRGLQFFFLKGGSEGFLDSATFSSIDASRIVSGGSTTSGGSGITMVFDMTSLLAAFDGHGDVVSSAPLVRPLSIKVPPPPPPGFHGWSEEAATNVLAAWNNCPVNLYFNHNYNVKYTAFRSTTAKITTAAGRSGSTFTSRNRRTVASSSSTTARRPCRTRQAKLGKKEALPAGTMRVISM
jgi:hypothetical protein